MSLTSKQVYLSLLAFSVLFLAACSSNANREETLVALGDSIPFGAMLEQTNNDASSQAYPDLIGEELGMDVKNLAVSGWRTQELIKALETDETFRKSLVEADYVSLSIGSNDLLAILGTAQAESGGNSFAFSELVAQKLSETTVYADISEIVEEIRILTAAPIVLFNVYNPFDSAEALHLIGESLLPEINSSFYDLAKSFDQVFLADAYAAYNDKQSQYVIPNDIHPTREGQAVLAEIGMQALGLK